MDKETLEIIAELEMRLGALERAYDFLLKTNPTIKKPTQADINRFRDDSLKSLKKQIKYANLGMLRSDL
jgi:hydrogenase maturation factor HypF (carbamoyltransferase family)